LDADDDDRDAERVAITLDLLSDAGGIAQQEAVARESLEVRRKGFAGRKRLVLLPLPVGLVLGPEEGPRLRDGRRRIRGDIAFLDERDLRRRRFAERLPGLAE
jgi:hypothetical protein